MHSSDSTMYLSRRGLFGVASALLISSLLLIGMILPAFLGPGSAVVIMEAFSTLCHQIAERSPHLYGQQLAACHRCLGIFLGLTAGCVVLVGLLRYDSFIKKYTPWLIAAAATPAATDWFFGWIGIWANTPASRVITGLLFGVVAGICMARAFADSFEQGSKNRQAETQPQ